MLGHHIFHLRQVQTSWLESSKPPMGRGPPRKKPGFEITSALQSGGGCRGGTSLAWSLISAFLGESIYYNFGPALLGCTGLGAGADSLRWDGWQFCCFERASRKLCTFGIQVQTGWRVHTEPSSGTKRNRRGCPSTHSLAGSSKVEGWFRILRFMGSRSMQAVQMCCLAPWQSTSSVH